jgi:hypothetical protein
MQAFAGSDNNASVAPDYFGSKVVDFAYFQLSSTAADAFGLLVSASIAFGTVSILY